MGFFKPKKDKETLSEGGGSNYLSTSGIYDVTILAPFVQVNQSGARSVDFFIDAAGQKQVVYGNLKLDNNDGSENFAAAIFSKLCIIADLDEVNDPEEGTLPIGKKGADKDCAVLTDFCDLDVKMRVQMEYSIYNGNISEKQVIKSFYRADGASGDEIVNDGQIGVQLEKDMPYATNVTYKDGLDEAAVTQWIADKRPKGTAGGATAPVAAPSFGAKKSFGKK